MNHMFIFLQSVKIFNPKPDDTANPAISDCKLDF